MSDVEVRRQWSGLVSVRQDPDNHQTGFMIGPHTIATATHGLSPTRPVNVCRIGRSADAVEEPATVVLWDERRDLCLLNVEGADDFWFVPDLRPLAMSAEYLVISCVGRRIETTVVVNEGFVEDAGTEWLKLRSGQIQRGYSGAPVLDRRDGRLVGMVRVTRGRQTDLGGHALVGREIHEVRTTLGLDRDDRTMQVRHAASGPNWLQGTTIRGNPPSQQVELLGREAQIIALDTRLGTPHRRVVGPTLAGKSTLTAVWVRLPHQLGGTTAYVDATQGPPVATTHPVIRMVLAVLDMTVPQDPFGSRSSDETLALACWTVMRDLHGGRLVVDLQQNAVTTAADADLAAMMNAADQMNVAVIVVGREFGDETACCKLSVSIEVGSVERAVAADLVERTTLGRVSREEAEGALGLIDSRCLLPGQILAACAECDDPVDIAIDLEGRSSLLPQGQEVVTQDVEPTAATDGDYSASSGTEVVLQPSDDVTDTYENAGEILERHIRLSASDPLGLRVPAARREALEPGTFGADALRLDEWTGSQPFAFTVDMLTREQGFALQRIAHRVSGRSLRSEWVGTLYRRIVELEGQSTEQYPSVRLHLPLMRSQIYAGDVSGARRTFAALGGHKALDAITLEASHLVRVQDAHLLVLAWWLGVGPDDVLEEAIGAWISKFATDERLAGRGNAKIVINDVLRAMNVRTMPSPDGLRSIAEWCLRQVMDESVLLADPGTWTMYVSLIGRAGDLSGDETLTSHFLAPALDALSQHLPLLKSLALSGDSRPLLTIARQERRLHRLEQSRRTVGRGRLGPALDLLTWTVENAPSPDAFLTLLAMEPALKATQERFNGLNSDLPAHRSAATRLANIRRTYRKWWKRHPRVDSTVLEIEYRIIRADWAIEGSLLRLAGESDERWVFRPIAHKTEVLGQLADARRKRLASVTNRFGESVSAIEMEARNESQFRTALAVVQRNAFDYAPVDEILARGARAFPSDPQMVFLLAAHHRQRRDFNRAASLYSDAFGLALGDPLVRLRSAVSACESLSQSYALGQCERDDLATAMRRAETYEATDVSASIVCTLARLEMHRSLSSAYINIAKTIAAVGTFPALAIRMRSIGAEIASVSEPGDSWLLDRFLHDFTDASVLVALGAMFIRSHVLSPSVETERLRAALVLLDGVRIMAGTTWSAPSVNFHQGRALLYACKQTEVPNPIGWDTERGRRDIDLACAKLQSAADLAVASFRDVVLANLQEANALRREFPRVAE